VPDRVQIDTARNRQNGIQNHAISGSHPGLNRTAVISTIAENVFLPLLASSSAVLLQVQASTGNQ
jgi:hypothetical protein